MPLLSHRSTHDLRTQLVRLHDKLHHSQHADLLPAPLSKEAVEQYRNGREYREYSTATPAAFMAAVLACCVAVGLLLGHGNPTACPSIGALHGSADAHDRNGIDTMMWSPLLSSAASNVACGLQRGVRSCAAGAALGYAKGAVSHGIRLASLGALDFTMLAPAIPELVPELAPLAGGRGTFSTVSERFES